MRQDINIPKAVYIYGEGISNFHFPQIKNFIYKNFGKIEVRLIRLKEKVVLAGGLLFDFIGTQRAFRELKYSKNPETCHIILTDKIFATYDAEKQIHIRAAIFSFPSIISTSGIVEGPAKPRQYYLYKQRCASLGIWEIEEPNIKKRLKGRFVDYGDKRLISVLGGYIAQALFFYIMGEPFCRRKNCRLYNAHWQEDLIYAQIKSGTFCLKHRGLLRQIKSALLYHSYT